MKTVVSAIDFSDVSMAAAEWAEQIAASHGARLVLAHALSPHVPADATSELVALADDAIAHDEQRAKELLEAEVAKMGESEASVDIRIARGPASDTVVHIASAENADLLVVGAGVRSGLQRALLGSVAAQLVRKAECPVLVVPPADGTTHRPIYKLLVPTDFSQDAQLAVEAALKLLGPISAEMKLTLLHVWKAPIALSPFSPISLGGIDQDSRTQALARLERVAAPLRAEGYEIDTRASAGEPAQIIDQVAADVGADIIAMGTHGRSGLSRALLGSVAERTLSAAPCPVLTVHARA